MSHDEGKNHHKRILFFHILELAILFISLLIYYLLIPRVFYGLANQNMVVEKMHLPLIVLITVLLIFTRIIRKSGLFLMASNLVFWVFVLLLYLSTHSIILEIQSDIVPGIFEWGVFIPIPLILVKVFIYFSLPFLSGLYFVRKGFGYWKFIIGIVIGIFAINFLDKGKVSFSFIIRLGNVFQVVLYLLLISLPLQRAAFERLLGFPLRSRTSIDLSASSSFFKEAIAHATLMQIFIILVLFSITGHYERKLYRMLTIQAPTPIYRSPALKNAYDDFKNLFTKHSSPKFPFSLDNEAMNLLHPIPPDLWNDELLINEENWKNKLEQVAPYIETLEKAKDSDYCSWYEPNKKLLVPDFYNFRETARFLGIRSIIRMKNDQKEEALKDIETILSTAWLLNTDGGLINHMLGVGLQWIGLNLAYTFFLKYLQDPPSLMLLETMLLRMAPKIRVSFDIENMKRYENALWPIVPYPEISVPGFKRAYINYYSSWLQFDQLILILVLERFRMDHGDYPDNLDVLQPGYISRSPNDPYQGKPYIYEKTDDSISIRCHLQDDPNVKTLFKTEPIGLTFPYSRIDNPGLREYIRKIKTGN